MGIIAWIIRGLAYAGPAAIGYFLNDLATWVASFFPSTNVKSDSGGWAWWFLLPLIAVLGAIGLVVLSIFRRGKKSLFMIALSLSVMGFDYIMGGDSGLWMAAGVLGVIPAGASGTFSIDYCPEIIIIQAADFSSFRIEVKHDGQIMSLDNAGLLALKDIGFVGEEAAGWRAYRIANGFVTKTTTFTATNTNVAPRTIRGFSTNKGRGGQKGAGLYHEFAMTKAFSNVQFMLDNFSFASFPGATDANTFTVDWRTKQSDNMNADELKVLLASTQSSPGISIDNRAQIVSKVRFTGAADQSVYYAKFKSVS
jgi:hypothetical protein